MKYKHLYGDYIQRPKHVITFQDHVNIYDLKSSKELNGVTKISDPLIMTVIPTGARRRRGE
jgi:hypothetical protein